MTAPRLMLCTDLDRTLLPNGAAPESALARKQFTRLVSHQHVILVYVTGRHQELVEAAISNYHIPRPNFVITDVGTKIYSLQDNQWDNWQAWETHIAADWGNHSHQALADVLADLKDLRLQEHTKQNNFKLSYYVPLQCNEQRLSQEINARLSRLGVHTTLVWSVDDPAGIGLLDILPLHAGKLAAIEFLREQLGYRHDETVFAGDSGNDLPVLTSALPAVLVANATDNVREAAVTQAESRGTQQQLYLARGNFMDMNGNYSAGIIEGVIHYHPELTSWLSTETEPSV